MATFFFWLFSLLTLLEICKSQVFYSEIFGSCGYYIPIVIGEQQYNVSISVRDYEEIFIPGVMCTECKEDPKYNGPIRYTKHHFEFTNPHAEVYSYYSSLETVGLVDSMTETSQFMVLLSQSGFLSCENESQGKMGLVVRKGTQVSNLFSEFGSFSIQICSPESEKIGNLWIGGYDPTVASEFENVPATYEKFAQVKLSSILVENNPVTILNLDTAIVSVDPTHKYFSLNYQESYINFVTALRNSNAINWGEETTDLEKDNFWGLSGKSVGVPVRNSTINLSYTITLQLGDSTINLYTKNLVIFYNDDGVDMMKMEGINYNQEENLIIIGGSMLRNRVIIYNRKSSLIGFSDERSTCSGNGTSETYVELDSSSTFIHPNLFTFYTCLVLLLSYLIF